MIEQGLAKLVQSNPAVAAIAQNGGFLQMLPKDFPLPSWTQQLIVENTYYSLTSVTGVRKRRIQIDCYAVDADGVVALADAIDLVLSGYHGTLSDLDNTVVQGVFQNNAIDFFDAASRTYRRVLDYDVWFNQGK